MRRSTSPVQALITNCQRDYTGRHCSIGKANDFGSKSERERVMGDRGDRWESGRRERVVYGKEW